MKLTGIPRAARFPRMIRVRQTFQGPTVNDVPGAVRAALARVALPVKPGQSVALTVGSRGVVNIDVIVRATVDHLKALGAHPFIIPAMGSHGGGTAEGQRAVLERYGVTEATMGCPVRATMDVVQIGEALGLPIWLDAHAAEADWLGVINRVKPHTGFTGDIGSGLLNVLRVCDIPDALGLIAPRPLTLVGVSADDFAATKAAYAAAGASDKLSIK